MSRDHTNLIWRHLETVEICAAGKAGSTKRLSEDIITLLTDEGEIITEVDTAELISDSIRESLLKIQKVIGTTDEICAAGKAGSTQEIE